MYIAGNTFCLKSYAVVTKQQKHEQGNTGNTVLCPHENKNKRHKNKPQSSLLMINYQ